MNSKKFTYRFIVPASAIDDLGHVNNVIYLQWCLDAAAAHWIEKTDKALRENYVWVVLEHYISYKNPAFEGEELEIQTWIHSQKGVKSERHYTIKRTSDNKTLIEAQTLWCLLDGASRRPIKIPDDISKYFI